MELAKDTVSHDTSVEDMALQEESIVDPQSDVPVKDGLLNLSMEVVDAGDDATVADSHHSEGSDDVGISDTQFYGESEPIAPMEPVAPVDTTDSFEVTETVAPGDQDFSEISSEDQDSDGNIIYTAANMNKKKLAKYFSKRELNDLRMETSRLLRERKVEMTCKQNSLDMGKFLESRGITLEEKPDVDMASKIAFIHSGLLTSSRLENESNLESPKSNAKNVEMPIIIDEVVPLQHSASVRLEMLKSVSGPSSRQTSKKVLVPSDDSEEFEIKVVSIGKTVASPSTSKALPLPRASKTANLVQLNRMTLQKANEQIRERRQKLIDEQNRAIEERKQRRELRRQARLLLNASTAKKPVSATNESENKDNDGGDKEELSQSSAKKERRSSLEMHFDNLDKQLGLFEGQAGDSQGDAIDGMDTSDGYSQTNNITSFDNQTADSEMVMQILDSQISDGSDSVENHQPLETDFEYKPFNRIETPTFEKVEESSQGIELSKPPLASATAVPKVFSIFKQTKLGQSSQNMASISSQSNQSGGLSDVIPFLSGSFPEPSVSQSEPPDSKNGERLLGIDGDDLLDLLSGNFEAKDTSVSVSERLDNLVAQTDAQMKALRGNRIDSSDEEEEDGDANSQSNSVEGGEDAQSDENDGDDEEEPGNSADDFDEAVVADDILEELMRARLVAAAASANAGEEGATGIPINKSSKSIFIEAEADVSEDEFAHLGGIDGEDDPEHDGYDKTLLADSDNEDLNAEDVARLHMQQELEKEKTEFEALLHDVTSGNLRKRARMADPSGKGYDIHDSDEENEALLRRIREKIRPRNQKNDDDELTALEKLAKDPQTATFAKTLVMDFNGVEDKFISSDEEPVEQTDTAKMRRFHKTSEFSKPIRRGSVSSINSGDVEQPPKKNIFRSESLQDVDISGNESDDHVLRELNGDEAFASQYIYERMVQKKEEERILIQKHQASFKSHIDIMARKPPTAAGRLLTKKSFSQSISSDVQKTESADKIDGGKRRQTFKIGPKKSQPSTDDQMRGLETDANILSVNSAKRSREAGGRRHSREDAVKKKSFGGLVQRKTRFA